MGSIFKGKRILVTGGGGFIGSHLTEKLLALGAKVRVPVQPNDKKAKIFLKDVLDKVEFFECDLISMPECIKATKGIDFVFHLAGFVRGVGYNKLHAADMLTINTLINTNVLEAARINGIERYLFTSSACGYPLNAKIPLVEDDFFNGDMEPTNATYGWAKRLGEIQAKAYAEQYGMKIAIVRPFNAYGPRDNFNLEECHVVPALIRKAVERWNPFIIWGDGTPTRVFVYVDDMVEGMLLAMEKYCCADPLNIGSEEEVTMEQLARSILEISGYSNAPIQFDKSKPGGQPRRCASIEKAKAKIGYLPKVKLNEGLKKTIEWYKGNKGLYK